MLNKLKWEPTVYFPPDESGAVMPRKKHFEELCMPGLLRSALDTHAFTIYKLELHVYIYSCTCKKSWASFPADLCQ